MLQPMNPSDQLRVVFVLCNKDLIDTEFSIDFIIPRPVFLESKQRTYPRRSSERHSLEISNLRGKY
jgi:hypothetical protein